MAVGGGVAAAGAVGSGVDVAVGSGVLVGAGVGSGVGVGDDVAVGVLVGAGVSVGCGVGVGDDVGNGVTLGTGVAVGSRAAVGAGVCVGVGVSAGVWIAAACTPVAGSGVAAGAAVAVGVTATAVATAGEICSPPHAARAVRTARHSSKTVEASPVPVGLTQNVFMAPFSASSTVESMIRPVYPPGVLVYSGGCLGRAVTPEFLFLRGGSAAPVGPAQRQRGLPVRELGTVDGRASVESPGYVDRSEHRLCEPQFQLAEDFPVGRVVAKPFPTRWTKNF